MSAHQPGKTIHINYFTIDKAMYLVDLPGYGYARVSKAEQQRWGALMETYFAMDLLTLGIQIVDIRHKPTRDDMTMAEWFRASGKPWVIIANKLDKIKKSQLEGNIAETVRRCCAGGSAGSFRSRQRRDSAVMRCST